MVYCVNGTISFSTAARRDAVLADMQARIVGKQRWGIEVLSASGSRVGPNGINVELRFSSQADADDLRARLEAFATGVRVPAAGSWLRVSSCTHDEGSNSCVVLAEKVW